VNKIIPNNIKVGLVLKLKKQNLKTQPIRIFIEEIKNNIFYIKYLDDDIINSGYFQNTFSLNLNELLELNISWEIDHETTAKLEFDKDIKKLLDD
jgi:hypothetical protein